MVLMLCMGTAAKAVDPVAFYSLSGCLEDNTGNGNHGTMYEGDAVYGADELVMDGDDGVSTTLDTSMFESDYTIVLKFKMASDAPAAPLIGVSSTDGDTDEHGISVWMNVDPDGADGAPIYDLWWTAAAEVETDGLNDNAWHSYAVVVSGDTQTVYIDGAEDGTGGVENNFDSGYTGSTFTIGNMKCEGWWGEWVPDWEATPFVGSIKDVGIYNVALDESSVISAMTAEDAYLCYGPPNPLRVDPNTMVVYETGETISDFDVSLAYPPVGQGGPSSPQGTPYTITVLIDPNGGNGAWGEVVSDGNPVKAGEKDIQLLDGQGADNQITLTFNTGNWNVPQTILFKALDDTVAEPPVLIEITNIGVTITSEVAEPNLNGPLDAEQNPWQAGDPKWAKPQAAQVIDNDQANILFTYSLPEKHAPYADVTDPVQLWEEPRVRYGSSYIRWRKIGVTLQVPPSGDPVKLQAVIEGEIAGDNFPLTDPCLPYEEIDDPNGLIFTAGNYNVSQDIKVWGNDDDVLQAIDAIAEGGQNYQASLVVTVVDGGGDQRYEWEELEDPCDPESTIMVGIERIVTLDIEDNECGAFGILPMDVSNPYYVTDPNWAEDDPDCNVDIHDVIGMAKRWFNCTDPQGTGCAKVEE